MIALGLGMRLEGDVCSLAVLQLFDGGPVALANEQALQDDPEADMVVEGDVLVSVGETELRGLSDKRVTQLLAESCDGDITLEFAHQSTRAFGSKMEHFSIVVQAKDHSQNNAVLVEAAAKGLDVMDLGSKANKKSARAKKEKEITERRQAKSDAKSVTTVSMTSCCYLQDLAAAPPVWVPPGGDFLSSLGAGDANQTTQQRLREIPEQE